MSSDYSFEWKNSDPREDLLDRNRAPLVIVRPSRNGSYEAGTGQAEMEYGWFIATSFENQPLIKDTWDTAWWWVLAPAKFRG